MCECNRGITVVFGCASRCGHVVPIVEVVARSVRVLLLRHRRVVTVMKPLSYNHCPWNIVAQSLPLVTVVKRSEPWKVFELTMKALCPYENRHMKKL